MIYKLDISKYYTPHEGQVPIHQSRANTKVLECARRSGKSRSAFGELMIAYQKAWVQKRPATLVPAFHVWVVVPAMPQGGQTWDEILSLMPVELRTRKDDAGKIIYLVGSPNWGDGEGYGKIEIKSAFEPEGLQTVGLDYLWINEAQDVSERAFAKLLPSTVSPDRLGLRVYEGIPALFEDHWFRRAYQQAKREAWRKSMFAYKMTYLDNPLLTDEQKEEIESHREILSDSAWRRMYMAEYSESAGFFKNIDACVSGDLLTGPIPGRNYVAGFDIGLSQDPSELFVLDRDSRTVVYWEEWDSGVTWPQQRAMILALHDAWGFREFVFDAQSLGGVLAEQEFMETNLPITPYKITGHSRPPLLERLAGAVLRGTISFPYIKPLIRQMRAFQAYRMKSGDFRLQAPPGEHDDCIFALALGLEACQPAVPVGKLPRIESGRYLPSQAEAEGGGGRLRGVGARFMRDRRLGRLRSRAERGRVAS